VVGAVFCSAAAGRSSGDSVRGDVAGSGEAGSTSIVGTRAGVLPSLSGAVSGGAGEGGLQFRSRSLISSNWSPARCASRTIQTNGT
jgi:hypothetical protein